MILIKIREVRIFEIGCERPSLARPSKKLTTDNPVVSIERGSLKRVRKMPETTDKGTPPYSSVDGG